MPDTDLLRLSAQIVSAHVGHNSVQVDELPGFIRSVYDALTKTATPTRAEALTPAVPIKKSVYDDYIVCLEDGKKLKMLKRHLQSAYGMTPDDYRARWGLPHNYPMTAPAYTTRRSALAKKLGLGRADKQPAPEVPVQKIAEGVTGKKSRRSKAVAADPETSAERGA